VRISAGQYAASLELKIEVFVCWALEDNEERWLSLSASVSVCVSNPSVTFFVCLCICLSVVVAAITDPSVPLCVLYLGCVCSSCGNSCSSSPLMARGDHLYSLSSIGIGYHSQEKYHSVLILPSTGEYRPVPVTRYLYRSNPSCCCSLQEWWW